MIDEVNEFQIIRRSSYYDYDKFNEFAKQNKDRFNILSTNIQSINAKFSELELFLEYLDSINFKFNVICMQETWKAEGDDYSHFMLQGYNCITQGKSSSSKGGLVIYIDDKYKADVITNLNSYEHWEGLILKVNGENLSKTLNIGNLYLYNTNSVCVSVEYRRPNYRTDHDQIWHAYADRPGNGSYQILAP